MECLKTGTNPSHYKQGKFETIDVIKDTMSDEMYGGFLLGNIIKYLSRYRHKNGLEDLEKAQKYLDWLIEHGKEREDISDFIKPEGSF